MTAPRRITDPIEAMAQRVAERAARLRFLAREAEVAAPPATASPLAGDVGAASER